MPDPNFERNVFFNCPFDSDNEPIMRAVLFCLVRFGFKPRIATERSNAAKPRIETICELIQASKYSIHEIAEVFIRLTQVRRRLSPDSETVGGPIDVAVISKADGFVWIKRKYYFDKELNYSFIGNYLDIK